MGVRQMEQITKIIEDCKNKLELDPFECYESGIFIINYIDQQGEKRSQWHGSKKDADLHYKHLQQTGNKNIQKDYRFFNKEGI